MNIGIGISIGSRSRGGFDPASLFGAAQGVFYNVTAANTGTTSGNPVSTMTDSSGRGNNATGTGTTRPLLNTTGNLTGLVFDGVDDGLSTAAFNLGTDKMTLIVGLRKASDTATGIVAEFSTNAPGGSGTFYCAAPLSAGAAGDFAFYAKGTGVSVPTAAQSGTFLAPQTAVLTMTSDIAADSRILRRNGVQVGSSAVDLGTGNFGNFPLFLGNRAGTSLPFNGTLYGLFLIARVLSASEIAQVEQWMAAKSGITF